MIRHDRNISARRQQVAETGQLVRCDEGRCDQQAANAACRQGLCLADGGATGTDRASFRQPARDLHALVRLRMGPHGNTHGLGPRSHRGDVLVEDIDVEDQRRCPDRPPAHVYCHANSRAPPLASQNDQVVTGWSTIDILSNPP